MGASWLGSRKIAGRFFAGAPWLQEFGSAFVGHGGAGKLPREKKSEPLPGFRALNRCENPSGAPARRANFGFFLVTATASQTSPRLTLVHDRSQAKVRPEADEFDQWGELDREGPIPVELLYSRFAPYVAAIASRILGREGEVQDVVQDVFAAAVRGLRDRSDPARVRGWLAKVAVRTSMRKLRARRFWSLFDLDEAPNYSKLADPAAGPYERQLVEEVYQALDEVGAAERVAWVLRHVEGESLERVAELCECSLATAKRRIKRAHDAIRHRLDEPPISEITSRGVYVD